MSDPAAIVALFQEVKSGKNNRRPELAKAMAECWRLSATLLVATLDRVSWDAAYILRLEVPFVAVDLLELNTWTKGIFARLAQHGRELISKRTKEALAAKKVWGELLGTWEISVQKAGARLAASQRVVPAPAPLAGREGTELTGKCPGLKRERLPHATGVYLYWQRRAALAPTAGLVPGDRAPFTLKGQLAARIALASNLVETGQLTPVMPLRYQHLSPRRKCSRCTLLPLWRPIGCSSPAPAGT
ncbi:recombinase family protein [Hymenobacter sp. GOD-10R]|uniref:recombinase family protein n=1 Tax=Hymenobacter sp. GOD-10R TaxID=3093922 RepID=UPI002D7732AD|nr:recombinase family protein [Hymenobacter sp. GOD-10R]WRQ30837.1 recombinase family protein [Hymenobacter sp. GOD-10R]